MPPEPDRLVAALSALAGGVFWGMHNLATALWARQPLQDAQVVGALANVAMAILGGAMAAYCLAPALTPLIPIAPLRDPHAMGFGIGAGSWELAPFVFGFAKAWLAKKVKEEGQ